MRALTYCDLWALDKEHFLDALGEFPDFFENIKVEMQKRNVDLEQLQQSVHKAMEAKHGTVAEEVAKAESGEEQLGLAHHPSRLNGLRPPHTKSGINLGAMREIRAGGKGYLESRDDSNFNLLRNRAGGGLLKKHRTPSQSKPETEAASVLNPMSVDAMRQRKSVVASGLSGGRFGSKRQFGSRSHRVSTDHPSLSSSRMASSVYDDVSNEGSEAENDVRFQAMKEKLLAIRKAVTGEDQHLSPMPTFPVTESQ